MELGDRAVGPRSTDRLRGRYPSEVPRSLGRRGAVTVNTAGSPGKQKAWETRAFVLCSDMKCHVLSRQDSKKLGKFLGKWKRETETDG